MEVLLKGRVADHLSGGDAGEETAEGPGEDEDGQVGQDGPSVHEPSGAGKLAEVVEDAAEGGGNPEGSDGKGPPENGDNAQG